MLSKISANTFIQLRQIIEQMSKEEYSTNLTILGESSIGQHVRHVLEFYICLADGIEDGVVNYDNRKRNIRLATEPSFALFVLDELVNKFCDEEIEEKNLYNNIEYGDTIISSKSSVSRELIYLIEHSIHHYAIMQIALKNNFQSIVVPEGFGIAYSTLKHKENKEICSIVNN